MYVYITSSKVVTMKNMEKNRVMYYILQKRKKAAPTVLLKVI